jgi:hypothetical protein
VTEGFVFYRPLSGGRGGARNLDELPHIGAEIEPTQDRTRGGDVRPKVQVHLVGAEPELVLPSLEVAEQADIEGADDVGDEALIGTSFTPVTEADPSMPAAQKYGRTRKCQAPSMAVSALACAWSDAGDASAANRPRRSGGPSITRPSSSRPSS